MNVLEIRRMLVPNLTALVVLSRHADGDVLHRRVLVVLKQIRRRRFRHRGGACGRSMSNPSLCGATWLLIFLDRDVVD